MAIFSRVTLAVKTLMPEKFLDALAKEGARIRAARREDGQTFIIITDPSGAEKAGKLAEKYSLEWEIRRVTGIKAMRDYMARRPTLPAAFVVMAIICAAFLTRVWVIDIKSLGGTLPAGAQKCIREAGIFPGAYWGNIDLPLLSLKITALEGAAYASASREGTSLVIEIAGEDAAPEIYDISAARDLVALCDGVISSVEVKSGVAMVKPGDTAKKGQVLISGEERASQEETNPVGALGSVQARIWAEGTSEKSILTTEKDFTGRESFCTSLLTPWFEYTVFEGETFENCDETTEEIPVAGLFLPLKIVRTHRAQYVPRTSVADRTSLENALAAAAIAEAEREMSQKAIESTEIIDKWIDFSMIDTDTLRARAVIEFTADIAVTRQYLEDN